MKLLSGGKIVLKKFLNFSIKFLGFFLAFGGKHNKQKSGHHACLTAPLSIRVDLLGIRLNKGSVSSMQ